MNKKKLVIFTTSEGHWSLSEAFRQKLSEKYEVEIFFDRPKITDVYSVVYQLFPAVYQIPFSLTKDERMLKVFLWSCLRHYKKRVTDYVKKTNPDVCLCVYSGYLPALGYVAEKLQVPTFNFVTEPRSIHPSYMNDAVADLVFDKKTAKICRNYQKTTPHIVGWPVRPDFEKPYIQEKIRQKLKLKKELFTVLIVSGSLGTNSIYSLLPAFLRAQYPVQVVVCCGKNRSMFRAMKVFQKLVEKVNPSCLFSVIGFTKQLHYYMQAANLVVGKAGPQSVFESVATKTPFFAFTHIPGLEDGMLDVIREYKVGYVEENPRRALKLLSKLIEKPETLESFRPALQKLSTYNAECGKKTEQIFNEAI